MMEIPFLICRPATTLTKENEKQPDFCIEPNTELTETKKAGVEAGLGGVGGTGFEPVTLCL